MKHSTYYYLLLVALCLVCAGARVYYLSQKDGFHWDAAYTWTISLGTVVKSDAAMPLNTAITGAAIRSMWLGDDPSVSGALSDVAKLRIDTKDGNHTSLYYGLVRLALIGMENGSNGEFIWRHGILNLLLATVSFFLLWALLRHLFPNNPWFAIVGAFSAMIAPSSISLTVLMKDYELQQTTFIAFAWAVIAYFDTPKIPLLGRTHHLNVRPFAVLVAVTALALLSGYFSLIFIGAYGIWVIIYHARRREGWEIFGYVMIIISALIATRIIYLNYFGAFSGGGSHAGAVLPQLKAFGAGVSVNLAWAFSSLKTLFTLRYFPAPSGAAGEACLAVLAGAAVIFALWRRREIFASVANRRALIVLIISAIFLLLIIIMTPIKSWRYIAASLPLLIILPLLLLTAVHRTKLRKILLLVLAGIMAFGALQPHRVDYLYRGRAFEEFRFAAHPEIPVFVIGDCYGPTLNMLYLNSPDQREIQYDARYLMRYEFFTNKLLMLYYHPRQTYVFAYKLGDLPEQLGADTFYVLSGNWASFNQRDAIDTTRYDIVDNFTCGYGEDLHHTFFSVMLVKAKNRSAG